MPDDCFPSSQRRQDFGNIGKRPSPAALAVLEPNQNARITTTKRIARTEAIKSVLLMAHLIATVAFCDKGVCDVTHWEPGNQDGCPQF